MNTIKIAVMALSCLLVMPVWAADKTVGEQMSGNCSGCHGNGGKSSNSQIPNLAAQQADYIVSQLSAFKKGARSNPMMQHVASGLSDEDMANLAAYFSSLPAVKSSGDAALASEGKSKSGMCLGCHGNGAVGNGHAPRLAGQQSDYLFNQLSNFKSGARSNGMMQGVANSLSEQDIKALAAYFQGL